MRCFRCIIFSTAWIFSLLQIVSADRLKPDKLRVISSELSLLRDDGGVFYLKLDGELRSANRQLAGVISSRLVLNEKVGDLGESWASIRTYSSAGIGVARWVIITKKGITEVPFQVTGPNSHNVIVVDFDVKSNTVILTARGTNVMVNCCLDHRVEDLVLRLDNAGIKGVEGSSD